jgi:nitric oxide reductase subunit B
MKKLWIAFAIVLVFSFAVLGWIGTRIYQEMPPIPARVVTAEGQVMIADGEIGQGQNVWQSMGGMEVGSIWGHGSYVAPDWTADWLHRELTFVLDDWSRRDFGKDYAQLSAEDQARLRGRLEQSYRTNTYDPATGTITVDPVRLRAFSSGLAHFTDVFVNGNADYSIPSGTIRSPERMRALSAFFFWTAWASATNRPNANLTYTHNWPHEALIGNQPSGEMVMWTGVSIIMLLAGIGALIWWQASQKPTEEALEVPRTDPLANWKATPSQKATLQYFWVVSALILVQMLAGVVTAHYGVEGNGFYGIDLAKVLPYAVTRTWHVQLGIFWIATAWLAAGLFMGPLVSGHEPKYQSAGVHVLFGALLLIVVGSLTGEWMSIQNKLSDNASFLWGHQGYEYLDLGRGWQWLLFAGLIIWLVLTLRPIAPMLRQAGEKSQLLWLFVISSAAIGMFYGAGLTWGQHTHLSMVEYWRWWVVHLWVEGFFEVFATTIIAFFFSRLGLIQMGAAARAALLSTSIYLAGGIIGTCHHLYFSGTPTVALAWGSVFSALEVVPLIMVAFPAIEDLRRGKLAPSSWPWRSGTWLARDSSVS